MAHHTLRTAREGFARPTSGMISVDTGPAHPAAALGCPLVVIFGVEEIEKNAPRGPTGAVRCLSGTLDGERSMDAVHPEQVVDAWAELPPRP